MTIADHVFVFLIAVVHPLAGYWSYQRLLRRARAGEYVDRARILEASALQHWIMFALCMALWAGSGRAWASLGFAGLSVSQLGMTIAFALAAVVVLGAQYRQVTRASRDDLARYRKSVGSLEILIPRNGNELGRFYLLSITAGIVEETLWRGFLIWYLAQVMPVWAAAAVSSIWFGVAHIYQGPANVPKIVLVGAVFAAAYLLTGSLWLAMLLHAVVDIVQGRVAYELVRRSGSEPGAGPLSAETATPGPTD